MQIINDSKMIIKHGGGKQVDLYEDEKCTGTKLEKFKNLMIVSVFI